MSFLHLDWVAVGLDSSWLQTVNSLSTLATMWCCSRILFLFIGGAVPILKGPSLSKVFDSLPHGKYSRQVARMRPYEFWQLLGGVSQLG